MDPAERMRVLAMARPLETAVAKKMVAPGDWVTAGVARGMKGVAAQIVKPEVTRVGVTDFRRMFFLDKPTKTVAAAEFPKISELIMTKAYAGKRFMGSWHAEHKVVWRGIAVPRSPIPPLPTVREIATKYAGTAPTKIYFPIKRVLHFDIAGGALAAMATATRVKPATAEMLQRLPHAGHEMRFKKAFIVKPAATAAQQVRQVQKLKIQQIVAQVQAFAKPPAFHHPPPAKLPLVVPLPNQPPRIVPQPKKARVDRFEPFLRVWPVGKIEKMLWGAPGRRRK
jgi:hypothetical protein